MKGKTYAWCILNLLYKKGIPLKLNFIQNNLKCKLYEKNIMMASSVLHFWHISKEFLLKFGNVVFKKKKLSCCNLKSSSSISLMKVTSVLRFSIDCLSILMNCKSENKKSNCEGKLRPKLKSFVRLNAIQRTR